MWRLRSVIVLYTLSRSHFTQANLELQGLFKYTRGCWLYNESEREYLLYLYSLRRETDLQENDIRYTPFDHEELARVACETMNARKCTLVEKLEEGMSLSGLSPLIC